MPIILLAILRAALPAAWKPHPFVWFWTVLAAFFAAAALMSFVFRAADYLWRLA